MKIIIAETKDFSSVAVDSLQQIGSVTLSELNGTDFAAAFQEYDVIWFRLGHQVTKQVIGQAPRCKYLVCPVTGLNHIDLGACEAAGITVLSLRGEVDFLKQVRATAEHTIGLTLALLRKTVDACNHVREGHWNRDLFKGQEIYGKKVGILGVGRLGTITAGYFKAFGAEVSGYDPCPFDPEICAPVTLDKLLSTSDILTIHVSYTPETHHLLNAALLAKMKQGAILINTSRGSIIHSTALIAALESGHISGAALDVVENEFSPEKDELIAYTRIYDRLLITPHIGGNTSESFEKTELFLVEKLKRTLEKNG